MNSLSWMIYAASTLANVNFVIGGTLVVGGIGGAILWIIGKMPWHQWSWDSVETMKSTDAARASFQKWGRRGVLAAAVAIPVGIVIPSDKTIYLIAASEAGETIVTSPEAKEVFEDLKTIIKSKLKEQLPKV